MSAKSNEGVKKCLLGPGDNIQKSKTLIETTPTVFSDLIKEDFVFLKKFVSLKKNPPMAKN